MALVVPTQQEQVLLRQLDSEADDFAYFSAIDANREHLNQFGDDAAIKYATPEDVYEARTNPSNPNELRLGIWDADIFVGGIHLTPDNHGSAEVRYWLDARYTGRGYATFATRAITHYALKKYSTIYARVTDDNSAGKAVLERAGFQLTTEHAGKLVFAAMRIAKTHTLKAGAVAVARATPQELERFVDMPSRRNALRAKDKDNLTVFLSFNVAKKLHRCSHCGSDIAIGSEHAVFSRIQMSVQHTHSHVDFECVQKKILPNLSDIQTVKPEEASAVRTNARRRTYRHRKRHS